MDAQLTALRAAGIFEGLADSLGARISPSAFGQALASGVCGLGFGPLYTDLLQPGLAALSRVPSIVGSSAAADEARRREGEAVAAAVRMIGNGVRGFAQACVRCHLVLSSSLTEFAMSLLAANSSHVVLRPAQAGPSVFVGGRDVGDALARAGRAGVEERWRHCGASLATSMALALGDDDDAVLFERPGQSDEWAAVEAGGRVRLQHEHDAHVAEQRALRLQRLHRNEHAPLAQPELVAEPPATTCCCCWAEPPGKWRPADGQLGGGARDDALLDRASHVR